MRSIEEAIDASVRGAVREELPRLLREALAEIRPAAGGDHVSVAEAARIADAHPDTVRLWIKREWLQRRKAGRELRVLRADLERFMAEGPPQARSASVEEVAAAILNKKRQ